MLHAAFQLLLYALLAGFSPVAFAATVSVMPAGRLKVLGFGVAFVLAQLVTCSLFVVIGFSASGARRNSHPDLHAGLELAATAALIWLALHVRRRPPVERGRPGPRRQKLLGRLGRVRLRTTLLAGLLLGIGGPKRLVPTALAGTTITTSGLHDTGEGGFVVLYVAVASVLVWAPVIVFLLLGGRAVAKMERAQHAVARRQPYVTSYALLLLAALLATDALGILLL